MDNKTEIRINTKLKTLISSDYCKVQNKTQFEIYLRK